MNTDYFDSNTRPAGPQPNPPLPVNYEYKVLFIAIYEGMDDTMPELTHLLSEGWEPIREIGLPGFAGGPKNYYPSITFILRRPKTD